MLLKSSIHSESGECIHHAVIESQKDKRIKNCLFNLIDLKSFLSKIVDYYECMDNDTLVRVDSERETNSGIIGTVEAEFL